MEVSQVVGVRTRAKAQAMAAEAEKRRRRKGKESRISYLRLRNRTLAVMIPEKTGSVMAEESPSSVLSSVAEVNCGDGDADCASAGRRGTASRCSGNYACSETLEDEECSSRSGQQKVGGEFGDLSRHLEGKFEEHSDLEFCTLESTARKTASPMPSVEEIEEFFATAEKREAKRFSKEYNYDVENDLALQGRYEWVQLFP